MSEETELRAAVQKVVAEYDSKLEPQSPDYNAASICVLFALTDYEDWSAAEECAPAILNILPEEGYQLVINLRAGGALEEQGYHPKIKEELLGEESGLVLALLSNVARGHMKYLPETNRWQVTPLGERAAKQTP